MLIPIIMAMAINAQPARRRRARAGCSTSRRRPGLILPGLRAARHERVPASSSSSRCSAETPSRAKRTGATSATCSCDRSARGRLVFVEVRGRGVLRVGRGRASWSSPGWSSESSSSAPTRSSSRSSSSRSPGSRPATSSRHLARGHRVRGVEPHRGRRVLVHGVVHDRRAVRGDLRRRRSLLHVADPRLDLSLGNIRYVLPTHYFDAWVDLVTRGEWHADLWRGALLQLGYVLFFALIGLWWFRRKDILS